MWFLFYGYTQIFSHLIDLIWLWYELLPLVKFLIKFVKNKIILCINRKMLFESKNNQIILFFIGQSFQNGNELIINKSLLNTQLH